MYKLKLFSKSRNDINFASLTPEVEHVLEAAPGPVVGRGVRGSSRPCPRAWGPSSTDVPLPLAVDHPFHLKHPLLSLAAVHVYVYNPVVGPVSVDMTKELGSSGYRRTLI